MLAPRPNLVLDVRYGMSRLRVGNQPVSRGFELRSLGLPGSLAGQLDSSLTTFPQLAITGYDNVGGNSGTAVPHTYHYLGGNLTWAET